MEGNTHAGALSDYRTTPATESGISDTVRNAASTAADKGQDALNAVKDKAANVPGMLADKLEAGADAVRPTHAPAMGGTGGTGALVENTRLAQASDKLADSMQASADFLRNPDFSKLREGLEQQVREKPTQSLLVALGVGYMLGKVVRR